MELQGWSWSWRNTFPLDVDEVLNVCQIRELQRHFTGAKCNGHIRRVLRDIALGMVLKDEVL
jgi:hypothetical protein